MIEVPYHLQIEPELGLHTEKLFQPKRRVRGDSSFSMNNFIHPGIRNPDLHSELFLGQVKRLQEFLNEHLSGMRWRTMRRDSNHFSSLQSQAIPAVNPRPIACSVIIRNFDPFRPFLRPNEADAELIMNPNGMLPEAIPLQRLQCVAWWDAKRLQRNRCVQKVEFPLGHMPNLARASAPCCFGVDPVEDVLSAPVTKGLNHLTAFRSAPMSLAQI